MSSRATKTPNPNKPLPVRTAEAGAQGERLQKLLAAAGVCSRRQAEELIAAGRVAVDGQTVKLGDRARPGQTVTVDGKAIELVKIPAAPRVLLYHKPVGELVTRSDPQDRPTIFARLPAGRWIAVGRLDLNSSGLLLLTDSGELANRLMHPRYGVEREYAVRVRGEVSRETAERLLTGIPLDGIAARFESLVPHERSEAAGTNRWYRVVLREGRNREVRRVFEALGHEVSRLTRVRYGTVGLPRDLKPGAWRELTPSALKELLAQ